MKTKNLFTALALLFISTLAMAQSPVKSDTVRTSTKEMIQIDSVYYSCPTHSNIKMGKAGKCVVCNLPLEKKSMLIVERTIENKEVINKTCTCHKDRKVQSTKDYKCKRCGGRLIAKKAK